MSDGEVGEILGDAISGSIHIASVIVDCGPIDSNAEEN